jgi:N-acetylneuraminic acid mutarotase
MSTARPVLAAATLNGKIYVVGGFANGSALSRTDVFDPATNVWNRVTNTPLARHSFGAAELGGRIYVVGGLNNGYWLSSVDAFQP